MIDRLFDAFKDLVTETSETETDNEDGIALAATALMIEVARSDAAKQDVELATIESILSDTFKIESGKIQDLMAAAADNVEAAHDLYQFTQVINEVYDYDHKKQLILAMWLVAFADGHVEAIEDHIIRRVAGLIHVPHADFIQLKIRARDSVS